jgi:hypothetical protein
MLGGFRNRMELVLTGLDAEAKADLALAGLRDAYPHPFEHALVRLDQPDAPTNEQAAALLRVHVKGDDPKVVGRASPPPPSSWRWPATRVHPHLAAGDATPYGVYWPALVPADEVEHVVVHADGRREVVPHTPGSSPVAAASEGPEAAVSASSDARPRGCRSGPSSGRGRATRAATPTSGSGRARTTPRPGCRAG